MVAGMQATAFNPFSSAALDRRANERLDEHWTRAALADPGTRFTLVRGTRHLLRMSPAPAIELLGADHPLLEGSDPSRWVLLGWWGEARCVLVESAAGDSELPSGTRFEELRPVLAALADEQISLLTSARALHIWSMRHRHCGTCGAPTVFAQAGHVLRCSSSTCGGEYFPRIDPAVIVVVSAGEHLLLGRQASWPPGRYSALAGFVEPGESLEDAVLREVGEETGVVVRACRYFASQAWPFPSSLMVGFRASAEYSAVQLDDELEDARWFDAAQLAADGAPLLPPRQTIARRLIESWYLEVTGTPLPATL